ncbi:MAG TPA: hypothetical protein VG266_00840 [Candidatus Dormibacteraeota bacterium]|jgi:hypothetical protein|nr:hypothetical protein [Candidatus Dormibacteraeota bacterium]
MSRANRRRAATSTASASGGATVATVAPEHSVKPARPTPRPTSGAPGAADAGGHISWRHCLIGWVVGEALLLLIANVGLDLANAAFGGTDRADGGIVGVASFVAVIVGGFVAARLAGQWGMYQGVVVAIGFIATGALYQFAVEASLVHTALTTGSHNLVDLGPMRIDNVVSGDLLALFGGSVGGLLARRR